MIQTTLFQPPTQITKPNRTEPKPKQQARIKIPPGIDKNISNQPHHHHYSRSHSDSRCHSHSHLHPSPTPTQSPAQGPSTDYSPQHPTPSPPSAHSQLHSTASSRRQSVAAVAHHGLADPDPD